MAICYKRWLLFCCCLSGHKIQNTVEKKEERNGTTCTGTQNLHAIDSLKSHFSNKEETFSLFVKPNAPDETTQYTYINKQIFSICYQRKCTIYFILFICLIFSPLFSFLYSVKFTFPFWWLNTFSVETNVNPENWMRLEHILHGAE